MLMVCVLCDFRMYIPIRRWVFLWTGFSLSIPKGSWFRSTPKPTSPRKTYFLFGLIFSNPCNLTQDTCAQMFDCLLCVSISAMAVCARWWTTSSRSQLEVRGQTSPAPTPSASATTGTNVFLRAPARRKRRRTHSHLRQAEENPTSNPALRMLHSSFSPHPSKAWHCARWFWGSSWSRRPRFKGEGADYFRIKNLGNSHQAFPQT